MRAGSRASVLQLGDGRPLPGVQGVASGGSSSAFPMKTALLVATGALSLYGIFRLVG
ncbi:UNVERIFIED_ORG: hypothetical protein LHJ69_07155 [Shinella sp. XGS7]|nr:hypothetical protein [Shinella sp. XGS7]